MNYSQKLLERLVDIFRPFARLSMGQGLKFGGVQIVLKKAFVMAARDYYALNGKTMTSSRISLLTGLQRRDIADLDQDTTFEVAANKLVSVHGHLLSLDCKTLSIKEFDQLAKSLYQDIHARTFLDEYLRLGLIQISDEEITILECPYINRENEDMQLQVFAENVEAHLETSIGNLLGDRPQLDQAAFAKGLHQDDADELEKFARQLTTDALISFNKRASEMIKQRSGQSSIRFGSYCSKKESDDVS